MKYDFDYVFRNEFLYFYFPQTFISLLYLHKIEMRVYIRMCIYIRCYSLLPKPVQFY